MSPCRVVALLVVAIAPFLSGCAVESASEPVTLSSWQKDLEQYVWDQANGNPNVLRDLSWDDIHHGFAIISDPLPENSTDAIGLLVAHQRIEQKPCFIFLFALVHDRVPQEIRAVALNVVKGQFFWSIGPPDPQALAHYRSNTNPLEFPARDDEFESKTTGDQITITHRQSGASWRVNLSPDSRPSTAT